MDHRVYICNGKVHLIPLQKDAHFTQINDSTVANDSIQQAILNRIKDFPAAATEHLHKAVMVLPEKVAHVLHYNQRLAAKAINAFYTRDAISSKVTRG